MMGYVPSMQIRQTGNGKTRSNINTRIPGRLIPEISRTSHRDWRAPWLKQMDLGVGAGKDRWVVKHCQHTWLEPFLGHREQQPGFGLVDPTNSSQLLPFSLSVAHTGVISGFQRHSRTWETFLAVSGCPTPPHPTQWGLLPCQRLTVFPTEGIWESSGVCTSLPNIFHRVQGVPSWEIWNFLQPLNQGIFTLPSYCTSDHEIHPSCGINSP